MWRKTAIKAAILRKVENFTNLFVKDKKYKKNLLDTLLVKNDEYVKEDQIEQKIIEDTKLSDVAPIIPKAVSKTIQYNSEVNNDEKIKDND